MTATPRDLAELVAKWRAEADRLDKSFGPGNMVIAADRRQCADELDALRAALAGGFVVKGSIEGTVKFMRSDASKPKVCICCEGPHIFCRYLDAPAPKNPAFTALDWLLYDTILQHNEHEGRRVRVTVELIEEAAAPTASAQAQGEIQR